MKFTGSVSALREMASGVEFTVTNIRQKGAAEWREYGPSASFVLPHSQARAFHIGRSVEIEVTAK
jgi:hypothetical protein